MAILSKKEFFDRVNDYIGDSNSDEDIAFFEDMTDTYTGLEKSKTDDGVDWEQKFKDNDAAWRAKYRNAFFRGDGANIHRSDFEQGQDDVEPTAENITFDDLFKKKEG